MQQLNFLAQNLDKLLWGFPGHRPGGLLLSLLLTGVALLIGLALAWPLGFALRSRYRPVRYLAQAYVLVFRGLPLLLLLVGIHQVVGNSRFGLQFSPLTSALISLTLYSSAYQSSIVVSGLEGLPAELTELAQTLTVSRWQRFRWLELPYIIRIMLPAFSGEAISLFKDSSVVVVLGVAELMTVARLTLGTASGNASYWLGTYLLVGTLYFLVALILTTLTTRWERENRPDQLIILPGQPT